MADVEIRISHAIIVDGALRLPGDIVETEQSYASRLVGSGYAIFTHDQTPTPTPDPLPQYLLSAKRGAPNGVAPLDADGLVPDGNLPGRLAASALGVTIANTVAVEAARADGAYSRRGVRISDLGSPWYVGHRGSALLAPEHSMPAYRMTSGAGHAIEQDVKALADGTLVTCHDTTTTRTMSISGNVADKGVPAWAQAFIKGASVYGGAGGWADNTLAPPLMQQVVNEFGNHAVLAPQIDNAGDETVLMNMLDRAGVDKASVLFQSGSLSILAAIHARGWLTAYLADSTDYAGLKTAGVDYVTRPHDEWDSTRIAAAHAAGLKVMLYTVDRRAAKVGKSADAWFSNDPLYLSGDTRWQRKTDPFIQQAWHPGMIPMDDIATNPRGAFASPNAWGFGLTGDGTYTWSGGTNHTCGHFYLTPTDPDNYVLTFDMMIDALNGGATTGGGYIYLGQTDKGWNNQNPATAATDGPNGYIFQPRASGNCVIAKKVYNPAGTGVATTFTPEATIGGALTLSSWYTFKITVSTASLKVERTDGGAGTAKTITAASDATASGSAALRGLRYISLGHAAAGVYFRNLAVT